MNKLIYYFSILFLLGVSACDLKENQVELLDQYLRIYDNSSFNKTYIPIDIKQTSSGGYLILGETNLEDASFPGVYLLLLDDEGNFVRDEILPSDYVHSVYNLMQVGDEFYFFCMHKITLITHLIKVNSSGEVSAPQPIADDEGNPVYYPLHAFKLSESAFLLQSFNKDANETVISQLSLNGVITKSRSFSIGVGQGVEAPIINHFTRTGKVFPFLTGKAQGNQVFFNGFYNYTFSMVMLDLDADPDQNPSVLQGVNSGAGISAAHYLTGNTFALSRFSFGQNYILPQAQVEASPESPRSSEDLVGNPFPELSPDAHVILKRINIGGREVLLYASDTRGKQIILLAYDAQTGVLLGNRYLGFSNPYELASFTTTDDGGLAVAGTTYVAGRFPRVCLFKLNAQDLTKLTSQGQ
jgi:hypothetical protein